MGELQIIHIKVAKSDSPAPVLFLLESEAAPSNCNFITISIHSRFQCSPADTRQKTAAEIDRTYHGNDNHGDSKWHTDSVRATHDFWTSKDGNVKAQIYGSHDQHNYGRYGTKSEHGYGIRVTGSFGRK
ncbi:hypothetical protein GE061_015291 [Apolygus lucorum]|uniref:Uncharacterized protein n=1 Tax=Apolygus lucorum TaxID=248454 RepID=A0A8S9XKP7_APOLU|nr:hypothetical protein GE061_015291 [Apolygus lucorum]